MTRLQPYIGSNWIGGYYKTREHPEYVAVITIDGYWKDWRLINFSKAFYTTIMPTNSGTVPLNIKQCRSAGFFDRTGLKITFPDGFGKCIRGRPSKIKKEYRLHVGILGYDKDWTLLKIEYGYLLPSDVRMGSLDIRNLGFLNCIGNKIIIEDGLGVKVVH